MMRISIRLLALALLFVGFLTAAAHAQSGRSRIPEDAIAWWRLDPSRFAANRADPALKAQREVVIAGLRAAVASGLMLDEGASRALEGLLAASEVGGRKHTLCLLELDAERAESGTGMAPRTLWMALELETGVDHAAILRTIRAILIGDSPTRQPANATQRELELPGGIRGVAYREAGWSDWREISWASTERAFVIGLGRGALERWFEAQQTPEAATPTWRDHVGSVDQSRPSGDVFFQAYMNLDRIREGFPDAFVEGRTKRVLEAVDLSNARDVMLHGRWIDKDRTGIGIPMIAADITWSARSEAPGFVRVMAISEASWPSGAVTMKPPPGSYVILIRADWDRWVRTALDLVPAASRTTSTWRRHLSIRRWLRDNGAQLDAFLAMLQPWVVVSDVPTPVTPMPGAATFFAELRPGVTAEQASNAFRHLLSIHGEKIVIQDGVWWFKVDPAGVLRIPAWGFVGTKDRPVMVGGWGPPVVTENRKRLGNPL